jgi:hypothetical protein
MVAFDSVNKLITENITFFSYYATSSGYFYGRFGTTYRPYHQGSRIFLTF